MADFSELIEQINGIINVDKRLRIAATTTHQLMAQRIFGEGKGADGGMIGVYDKTPLYVNPNRSPKSFSPMGKNSKQAKKLRKTKVANKARDWQLNLKTTSKLLERKTRYFGSGYFEFRAKAGRQNSHVDLRLTGTLEGSFVVDRDGGGYVSGFINEKQALIAEGNEDHFETKIFELTEPEQEGFVELMIPE